MKLKDKISEYVFKRAIGQPRAGRQIISLGKAKSIGILYDATQFHQEKVILEFAEQMRQQGKSVVTFGYINKKKVPPEFKSSVSNAYLSRSDLNWYGIPKRSAYALIANESFDVLINMYLWHCIPLLIISAASKAKFRIGRYFADATSCFDFMLNLDSTATLEIFIASLKHFSAKFQA